MAGVANLMGTGFERRLELLLRSRHTLVVVRTEEEPVVEPLCVSHQRL